MTETDEDYSLPLPPKLIQVTISAVSLASFVTSAMFLKSCDFVSTPDMGAFGLFSSRSSFEEIFVCVPYPLHTSFYNSFIAARAMGVIAAIFGGFTMVVLAAGTMMQIEKNAWKTCGAMLVFSFVFQSLTFLVFYSGECRLRDDDGELIKDKENQCTLELGAFLSISAAALYLGAGVAISITPNFKRPLLDCWQRTSIVESNPEQSREIIAPQQPEVPLDAAPQKTIKRIRTLADGSQVVSFESCPV